MDRFLGCGLHKLDLSAYLLSVSTVTTAPHGNPTALYPCEQSRGPSRNAAPRSVVQGGHLPASMACEDSGAGGDASGAGGDVSDASGDVSDASNGTTGGAGGGVSDASGGTTGGAGGSAGRPIR